MAEWRLLVGRYVGRPSIRPGQEANLTPAEKKKLAKNRIETPLELRADQTFSYGGTTEGAGRLEGDHLTLEPSHFEGKSRADMEEAAAASGRAFVLGWLFNPILLTVNGADLVSEESSTIETRFVRR